MVPGYLRAGRGHVRLRFDPMFGEPLAQGADEVAEGGARLSHRHRRGHAKVDEEVGSVRRARHAPGEAAADRADVDDAAPAAVGRPLLPLGCELEHRVEHVAHPDDRSRVALAFAERRVDERTARGDAQPERPVVSEDDFLLRRLAQHAHVGHRSVRGEKQKEDVFVFVHDFRDALQ